MGFLNSVETASTYRIDGHLLTLIEKNGEKLQLKLEKTAPQ
jgi:hypothetical protein